MFPRMTLMVCPCLVTVGQGKYPVPVPRYDLLELPSRNGSFCGMARDVGQMITPKIRYMTSFNGNLRMVHLVQTLLSILSNTSGADSGVLCSGTANYIGNNRGT